MVDDVAAEHGLEIGLSRLGRAGDGSGGDEVGEKGRVAERRRQVDQQHLARVFPRQRGGRVDGQGRRAGAAFGREKGDDRRRGPRAGLRLDRRRCGQLLLP